MNNQMVLEEVTRAAARYPDVPIKAKIVDYASYIDDDGFEITAPEYVEARIGSPMFSVIRFDENLGAEDRSDVADIVHDELAHAVGRFRKALPKS